MIHRFLKIALFVGFSSLLLAPSLASFYAAEQVEVSAELERLAALHGFAVTGLENAEAAVGTSTEGDLYPQLRRLLENFNHVIIQGAEGRVARVIVLGEKLPFEPVPLPLASEPESVDAQGGDIVIESERRGTQHLVQVALGKKNGSKVDRNLSIDTGADYLVLPLSLVGELGVDKQGLQEHDMQTANGRVKAKIGRLPSLWLGGHRIENVETAFLEDDKLGGAGLLGMSVLGRYKLTIDDANNRITLRSKNIESANE